MLRFSEGSLRKGDIHPNQVVGSQSRQKKYTNHKVRDMSFKVGEQVLLRMKGFMGFGKKGKLSLWYISPFEILDNVVLVAHRLSLSSSLLGVHLGFYVSMLKEIPWGWGLYYQVGFSLSK